MKKCTKCGIEKSIDEFEKLKIRPTGRGSRCKLCANKQARDYYYGDYAVLDRYNPVGLSSKRQAGFLEYEILFLIVFFISILGIASWKGFGLANFIPPIFILLLVLTTGWTIANCFYNVGFRWIGLAIFCLTLYLIFFSNGICNLWGLL